MSGHRFPAASFAHNRWAVGPATAPRVDADRAERHAAARTEKFKRDRIKKQLRKSMMAVKPFCHDCGVRLQDLRNDLENYACIIGVENPVMTCLNCAKERTKATPPKRAAVTMPETPHFTALMEAARDTFGEGVFS